MSNQSFGTTLNLGPFSDNVTVTIGLTSALSSLLQSVQAQITTVNATLARIESKQDAITKGLSTIMATEQQGLDLLQTIKSATDQQGLMLASEATAIAGIGTSLNTVSSNIDTLIAQGQAAGVPQSIIDGLQAQKDALTAQALQSQAVSDSINAQANFSTALASKGVNNPVPVPVPPATPPPAPAT